MRSLFFLLIDYFYSSYWFVLLWSWVLLIYLDCFNFISRFDHSCCSREVSFTSRNLLGETIELRQAGTIEEYRRRFHELLPRAESMWVDQLNDILTTRLSSSIRLEVEMQKPSNLIQAMNLARTLRKTTINQVYQLAWIIVAKYVFKLKGNFCRNNHCREKSQFGGGWASTLDSNNRKTNLRFVRRLSRVEMTKQRENGFLLSM